MLLAFINRTSLLQCRLLGVTGCIPPVVTIYVTPPVQTNPNTVLFLNISRHKHYSLRSEAVTTVLSCDNVMPYSLLEIYKRFGETLNSAVYGSSRVFRNVGKLQPDYTASISDDSRLKGITIRKTNRLLY